MFYNIWSKAVLHLHIPLCTGNMGLLMVHIRLFQNVKYTMRKHANCKNLVAVYGSRRRQAWQPLLCFNDLRFKSNIHIKGTQPLIFLLSYPEQFGSLINVRYKINLKVEYFIFKKTFSKNPKVPLPLKNWLPEQNMALKTWLPEQNMALEYWYRNRMCLSNIGAGTECGFQILVPEHKLANPIFVPVPIFERHFLF